MKQFIVKATALLLTFSALIACEDESSIGGHLKSTITYEVVDLGLPSGTLWADRNVGAKSPEAYGCYFAWGETNPKSAYSWNTYKWCEGSSTTLTKYFEHDDIKTLDSEDDAATVNMGPEWRMPTAKEQQELIDYCTWIWKYQKGVAGYELVGPNGNSIFLPASGYCVDSYTDNGGKHGYYWSNSLVENGTYNASELHFYSGDANIATGTGRFYGLVVRAVSLASYRDDVDKEDGNNDASNSSSSQLIGNWVVQKSTTYYSDGNREEEIGKGAYWIFSETKVTMHDEKELFDGESLNYTYNANSRKLSIDIGSSFKLTYTVKTITGTSLVIQSEVLDGSYEIIEFEKKSN